MFEQDWIVLCTMKTSNFEITEPCSSMLAAAQYIAEKEHLDEVRPTLKLTSTRPGKPNWRFDLTDKPYIYVAEWKPVRKPK